MGVGLPQAQLVDQLQQDIAEFIGGVIPVFIHPADGHHLVTGHAAQGFGQDPGESRHGFVELDAEGGQDLFGLFPGQSAGGGVFLIKRKQDLVQAAHAQALSQALLEHGDMDQQNGLHGLEKIPGTKPGHLPAGQGQAFQVRFSLGGVGRGGQVFRQAGVAFGKGDHSPGGDLRGLIKLLLGHSLGRRPAGAGFLQKTVQPDGQDLVMVGGQMGDAAGLINLVLPGGQLPG